MDIKRDKYLNDLINRMHNGKAVSKMMGHAKEIISQTWNPRTLCVNNSKQSQKVLVYQQ